MDPTLIKPPDQDRALVKVEGTPGVEAHRVAPMLRAGAVPGRQGTVRVWAPETRELVRAMAFSVLICSGLCLPLLLFALLYPLSPGFPLAIAAAGALGIALMWASIRAGRAPPSDAPGSAPLSPVACSLPPETFLT